MPPLLHYEIDLGREQSVEVSLNKFARIYLVDDKNLKRMKTQQRFRYFGRRQRRNSVIIRPDHPGHWNVVVADEEGQGLSASIALVC